MIGLLILAEGGLGTPSLLAKFSPGLSILHACVGHLLFAATVVAVVLSSPGRSKGPDTVIDAGWPSLRSLSMITPVFVLVQILLGASFRHKAMGVMPHIAGAIIVALLILLMGCLSRSSAPHTVRSSLPQWP